MSIVAGRNIITITQGGILYRDNDNKVCWLDFSDCLRTQPVERRVYKYVGDRNLDYITDAKVKFYSSPPITFEFESYEDRAHKLLKPLANYGWFTFDRS